MSKSKSYVLPKGKVLVLRTCNEDLTSHGGFQWKSKGIVKCEDWSEQAECGNGLHGLLWGEGDGSLLDWSEKAKWLVVEVSEKSVVGLGRKVKYPQGKVVYCGERKVATDIIAALAPKGSLIVGVVQEGGYRSTITGGHGSTITGGDGSTITGGDGSTITGGYRSTITGGHGSTITGGDGSTITGGDGSTITFAYWDNKACRRRVVVVYPGEDGIEIAKPYRLDENNKPMKVE